MTVAFNLTAKLNVQGPFGIKPVVDKIRKSVQNIKGTVHVDIDSTTNSKLQAVHKNLLSIENTLKSISSHAAATRASLKGLSTSLGKAGNAAQKAAKNQANANAVIASTAKGAAQAASEMEEFGRVSGLAIRRFAGFTIGTTAIFGLIGAIVEATKEAIAFERELVKISQVTGRTIQGLSSLKKEVSSLATSLGVSSSSLLNVARILNQAGITGEKTRIALQALAKTSLAPTFDDITQTTEGAIAALQQFNLDVKDLESSLGSINAVAGRFAVESGDIINAIRRTGGVFAAASGNDADAKRSLQEFIALFTSVRSTTRESAESIATGLRTIFTRIQRGSTIEQLREVGIELQDLEGKFIGPFKAVERLSIGLSSLDPRDVRFSKIVEELGGFRQIGKVIPLIQQFAKAQDALKVAQEGQDSLAKDAITAQQSLAIQFSKTRESFLALIRDVSDTKTFRFLAESVLGITNAFINLAGAIKPILPLVAGFLAVKGIQNIFQFGKGFRRGVGAGGGASGLGERLATGQTTAGVATTQANTAAETAQKNALTANTKAVDSLSSAVKSLEKILKDGLTIASSAGKKFGFSGGGAVRRFGGGGNVSGKRKRFTDGTPRTSLAEIRQDLAAGKSRPIAGQRLIGPNMFGVFAPSGAGKQSQKIVSELRSNVSFGGAALQPPDANVSGKGFVTPEAVVQAMEREPRITGKVSPDQVMAAGPAFPFNLDVKGIRQEYLDRSENAILKGLIDSIKGESDALRTRLNIPGAPQPIDAAFLQGFNPETMIGNIFEAIISRTAGKISGAQTRNENFDFPDGLGATNGLFDLPDSSVPTDLKSRLSGEAIKEITSKIARHFAERLPAGSESEISRATSGGMLFREEADPITGVKALLEPQELVFGPAAAQQAGLENLLRFNETGDPSVLGNFDPRGVTRVPGISTGDSFATTLPDGSFVVKRSSSENLGGTFGDTKRFKSGGAVKRFQNGGRPTVDRPEKLASRLLIDYGVTARELKIGIEGFIKVFKESAGEFDEAFNAALDAIGEDFIERDNIRRVETKEKADRGIIAEFVSRQFSKEINKGFSPTEARSRTNQAFIGVSADDLRKQVIKAGEAAEQTLEEMSFEMVRVLNLSLEEAQKRAAALSPKEAQRVADKNRFSNARLEADPLDSGVEINTSLRQRRLPPKGPLGLSFEEIRASERAAIEKRNKPFKRELSAASLSFLEDQKTQLTQERDSTGAILGKKPGLFKRLAGFQRKRFNEDGQEIDEEGNVFDKNDLKKKKFSIGIGAAIGASAAIPFLQDIIGDETPTAAATGAGLSGAISGGLAGSQFGPVGAALGAVAGGAIAFADSFHEAERRIAETNFGESLEKFGKDLEKFGEQKLSGSSLQKASTDLFKKSKESAILTVGDKANQTALGLSTNLGFGFLNEIGALFGKRDDEKVTRLTARVQDQGFSGAFSALTGEFTDLFRDEKDKLNINEKQDKLVAESRSAEFADRFKPFIDAQRQIIDQNIKAGRVGEDIFQGVDVKGFDFALSAQNQKLVTANINKSEEERNKAIEQSDIGSSQREKEIAESIKQNELSKALANRLQIVNKEVDLMNFRLQAVADTATLVTKSGDLLRNQLDSIVSGFDSVGQVSIGNFGANFDRISQSEFDQRISGIKTFAGDNKQTKELVNSAEALRFLKTEGVGLLSQAAATSGITGKDAAGVAVKLFEQAGFSKFGDTIESVFAVSLRKLAQGEGGERGQLQDFGKIIEEQGAEKVLEAILGDLGPIVEESFTKIGELFEKLANEFGKNASQYAKAQLEAIQIQDKINSLRVQRAIKIRELQRNPASIREVASGEQFRLREQLRGTGVRSARASDIGAELARTQRRRTFLQGQLDNAGGGLDIRRVQELQKQLAENTIKGKRLETALDNLATNVEVLSAIEREIVSIQQRRDAGRDITQQLLAAREDPTKAVEFASQIRAAFGVLGGGRLAAGDREKGNAFLDSISRLLPEKEVRALEKRRAAIGLAGLGKDAPSILKELESGKEEDRLIATFAQVSKAQIEAIKIQKSLVISQTERLASIIQKLTETQTAAFREAVAEIPKQVANARGSVGGATDSKSIDASRANGGIIPGASKGTRVDSKIIKAQPGEFIVNRRSTMENRGLLESINSGKFAAEGGAIATELARLRDKEDLAKRRTAFLAKAKAERGTTDSTAISKARNIKAARRALARKQRLGISSGAIFRTVQARAGGSNITLGQVRENATAQIADQKRQRDIGGINELLKELDVNAKTIRRFGLRDIAVQAGRARARGVKNYRAERILKETLRSGKPFSSRATGGGVDNTIVGVQPGEFVVNKRAAQNNMEILQQINSGNLQKFAQGGVVGGPGATSGGGGGMMSVGMSPEAVNAMAGFNDAANKLSTALSNISNIGQLATGLSRAAEQLKNVKIPERITFESAPMQLNVVINGADVLQGIEENTRALVINEIKKSLSKVVDLTTGETKEGAIL